VIRFRAAATLIVLAGLTAACEPVTMAVGAGATVGVAAAEERGFDGAIDDTKIRAEINNLWFAHDADMYRKVEMTVNEGRVMLTGAVQKPEFRVDAVRLTWQAAGVRQVIDEIQVTDQGGVIDYSKDVVIANNLRSRLMFDQHIKNVNYTVDVVNGVVYLMGIAQDDAELDRVIAHARDIGNVKRVVSHVMLKTDIRRRSS
jgi:osmotically-inducible protein OsmY